MLLNELKPAAGSKRASKRIGRGHGSGWGKTAGKGHNGQKQRAGASIALHFEGGQMPLIRRIPKRGFSNSAFKTEMKVINLMSIVNNFEDGQTVNLETLIEKGILKNVKFITKKSINNEEVGYSRKEKKEFFALNETCLCVEQREYIANLKVIGNCEVNKKLNFEVHKISKKAKELIEAAGGSVKLLSMKGYIRNDKKVASN